MNYRSGVINVDIYSGTLVLLSKKKGDRECRGTIVICKTTGVNLSKLNKLQKLTLRAGDVTEFKKRQKPTSKLMDILHL